MSANFQPARTSDLPDGRALAQPSLLRVKPTVLVAEDHADTREMLKLLLEMEGYAVAEAADGLAAVELAEHACPDLILMDGSLPRLDGLTAVRRLRAHEALHTVPVVALSGHVAPAFQAEARAAGCDAFLAKPIDFDEMRGLLARLLAEHAHATH